MTAGYGQVVQQHKTAARSPPNQVMKLIERSVRERSVRERFVRERFVRERSMRNPAHYKRSGYKETEVCGA